MPGAISKPSAPHETTHAHCSKVCRLQGRSALFSTQNKEVHQVLMRGIPQLYASP